MWYVTHLRVGADESVTILTPNKNVRTAFEILETPIRFLIKQSRGPEDDGIWFVRRYVTSACGMSHT